MLVFLALAGAFTVLALGEPASGATSCRQQVIDDGATILDVNDRDLVHSVAVREQGVRRIREARAERVLSVDPAAVPGGELWDEVGLVRDRQLTRPVEHHPQEGRPRAPDAEDDDRR